MYYYLRGILALLLQNTAVIDCNGVGYKLTVSSTTVGKIAGKLNTEIKLFTYLAVREDAMELYGFYSEEELEAYQMLIGVSGVGPKAALSILSCMTSEKLAAAIVSGDTKLISKAPGVGAKTAARVVLELKDKISKEMDSTGILPMQDSLPAGGSSSLSDALEALMVLGYSRMEASNALHGLDVSKDTDVLVREALKKLANVR